MFTQGQRVRVTNPDGPGWMGATFCEVAENQPKRIENPGVNEGAGYLSDQAWVIYQEGDREGTTGLHPINEEIRPADFEPDSPAET